MMDRAILKWDRAKTFELNPEAYIDVAVGGKLLGRLRFELYEDAVPYTVANFLALGEFNALLTVLRDQQSPRVCQTHDEVRT